MKNKLITFNLITISLVIFVITATGNYFYQKSTTKSRFVYTTELQKQLSNSFLMKIRNVENTLEVLSTDSAIIDYLKSRGSKAVSDKVLKEQAVRDVFYTYGKTYPEYLSMVLVTKDGNDYISNDSYRIENDSFVKEIWFKESMTEGYSYQFYNAIRNLKSWKIYDNHTFLSIAKSVKVGEESIGVLLIDLSLQDLRDFYRDLELDTNNFFFLMDSAGQVILSPANDMVHRVKAKWFTEDEGVIRATLLNRQYNLIYNKFAGKKITIVSAYDVLKEQDVLKTFFQLSLSVAMVAFLLAITWSIFFVSKVTKPLIKLASLMKKASTGYLELRFEEECDTEIQALGDAFNKMVVKIKELIGIVHEEKQQKKDAQLLILHEQVKPKFLDSNFELIRSFAEKKDVDMILHVTNLASDFYKRSLIKNKDLLTLEEELKMVSIYLDLQILQNENMFTYEIYCPKELKEFKVPFMSIQSLADNSINHGIKSSGNEGAYLKIKVMDEECGITILIEDNGSRMPSSIMRQLNYNLSHNDWTEWEGGLGIQEIGRNLWQNFGRGSGLSYYINRKGFTVAKLTILNEKEEEKQN